MQILSENLIQQTNIFLALLISLTQQYASFLITGLYFSSKILFSLLLLLLLLLLNFLFPSPPPSPQLYCFLHNHRHCHRWWWRWRRQKKIEEGEEEERRREICFCCLLHVYCISSSLAVLIVFTTPIVLMFHINSNVTSFVSTVDRGYFIAFNLLFR